MYYNFEESNNRYFNLTLPISNYLQKGGQMDIVVEIDAYSSKSNESVKLTDFRPITRMMPI